MFELRSFRRLALGCRLLIIAAAGGCADPVPPDAEETGKSIINGSGVLLSERADRGLVDVNSSQDGTPLCSGFLYGENWVMTAWHCVNRLRLSQIALRYENGDFFPQIRDAHQVLRFGQDLAIIKSSGRFTRFEPGTRLRFAEPFVGMQLKCYGRGASAINPGGGFNANTSWHSAVWPVAVANHPDGPEWFEVHPNDSGQIGAPGDAGGPCFREPPGGVGQDLVGVYSGQRCVPDGTCGPETTSVTRSLLHKGTFRAGSDAAMRASTFPGIRVESATYGGAPCNGIRDVSGRVKSACDQRLSCSYLVDHRLLGDPSPGCRKPFRVNYQCSGSESLRHTVVAPEASGKTAELSCDRITVLRATYGFNLIPENTVEPLRTGFSGNATAHVGATCNGLDSCSYVVNTANLGDPAPDRTKSFYVQYLCGANGPAKEVEVPDEAHGNFAHLSCP
jgi:hypothetical protein